MRLLRALDSLLWSCLKLAVKIIVYLPSLICGNHALQRKQEFYRGERIDRLTHPEKYRFR